MPIAEDFLETDLRQIQILANQVPATINSLLAAARDPKSTLTVNAGLNAMERAVEAWITFTDQVDQRLEALSRDSAGDRFDFEARRAGIALLHVSIAEDLAVLSPFDAVSAHMPVAAVLAQAPTLPNRVDTTEKILGEGGLRESLSEPIEEDDPEQDATQEPSPEAEGAVLHAMFTGAVDDVVKDMVDRAGAACASVVVGLAGPAIHAVHPLREALNLAPGFISEALRRQFRRIAKLVKFLVKRAREIFDSVCSSYREVLAPVQDNVMEAVTEHLGGRLVARLLDADKVRANAVERLSDVQDSHERDARIKRMRKLKKIHARWVGPVRYAGHGLPLLAPIMIGPVPSAAVAGVGLLSWAVIVTGDQLDTSRRYFPDCWAGVVRRAGGK